MYRISGLILGNDVSNTYGTRLKIVLLYETLDEYDDTIWHKGKIEKIFPMFSIPSAEYSGNNDLAPTFTFGYNNMLNMEGVSHTNENTIEMFVSITNENINEIN